MDRNGQNKINFFEPVILTIFWVILFGAPLLFGNFEQGLDWEKVLNTWRPLLPLFLAFLINRFILLPQLFFNRKRGWYLLAVVALIGMLMAGNEMISPSPAPRPKPRTEISNRPPPPGPKRRHDPRQRPHAPFPKGVVFSFLCLMVIGMDTGLKSAMKLSESERANTVLEKENITSQLAFLRNQVSPHFFMNTLNNIHSLIDIDTKEAKESIIRLSKLMRHLLYESESERLPLKKEIDFIKSYVELMKLRYSSKVEITLKTPVDVPERNIPPLLFTSILENAFNYGISYGKPSFIDISLTCAPDSLTFTVKNSNHKNLRDKDASGIGLENTRKRLDLLYGNKYTLDINEEIDLFTVNLHLPL